MNELIHITRVFLLMDNQEIICSDDAKHPVENECFAHEAIPFLLFDLNCKDKTKKVCDDNHLTLQSTNVKNKEESND